ncbi:MAG: hypothetical protein HYX73_07950 [Acidobacteria bacterium]|nr:hypothetical protein [Acidobacteriota bacterium]
MTRKNIFVASGAAAGVAILAGVLIGRPGTTVSADAQTAPSKSWLGRLTGSRPELVMVPIGTRISVRLQQGISSEKNNAGDTFAATLDAPLRVNGKTLAPAGTRVEGLLTNVIDSGRVEGKASLTMILRQMMINGEEYTLSTQPMTLVARSTKKKDAKIIGGSAAAGAVIGAIAGGGKGAAIGAAVGGGSGTGYVLATKGDPVAYGPETRFTFVLTEAIDLPVNKS